MASTNAPSLGEIALQVFLARCNAYCEATGWATTRLSRALFGDDDRIGAISATPSDTGVKRLARAERELARLADQAGVTLPAAVENVDSDSRDARAPA